MSTIKLLRSELISNSLKEAVEKLNTLQHIQGQPVISYYKLNDKINCVFAIGVKDGVGKDSYSIISTEDKIVVDKIIFGELPDITEIHQNQLVLCKTSDKLYWVTNSGVDRVVTEITNEDPILIKDINTGKSWWVNKQELKEISDFPTKEEFTKLSNRTQSLEQTNKGIIFPMQEKHEEEISLLMEKTYPLQIKLSRIENDKVITVNEEEIYEAGTIINISVILMLENKSLNITDECTWEVKRKSVGEFVKIENPNEVILTNCTSTETFIFKAIHPELGEIEKEYKAIFSTKTIIGKIKYPETVKPTEFYTVGKGLPLDEDTFILSDVIDSIPEEEKERVLRKDSEEIVYSGSFNINEYLFIAIPVSHKFFSDIIDNTTGYSIIDDFELFGEGDELELNRDYIEGIPEENRNKGMYYLYLKKYGVHSSGKTFSITFKP